MDIPSAIASASKALEVLKAIKDINKNYDDATWKAKVAELMSDIADIKIALIDANDKVRELEKEKEGLSDYIKFKADHTMYQNGNLYEVFDGEKISELPFCQSCLTDGKYIRIARSPIGGTCMCPGCKTHYDMRSMLYRQTT